MANTPPQDDRFYKPSTLWKLFGISSLLMLVFTIWMVMDDFGREWKGYQLEFFSLKKKKYEALMVEAEKGLDPTRLKELETGLSNSLNDLKSREAELQKVLKDLDLLKTKEKLETVRYQNAKIEWDVEKFHHEAKWGHKIAEGHHEPGNPKEKKSYDALMKGWNNVVALRDKANVATQAVQDKDKERLKFFEAREKHKKELGQMRAEYDRLKGVKEGADMTPSKLVRNAPILDLASPVLKINQIVVPTIRDDVFFAQIQKVDRCTTCHLAIDLPGFEKEQQPYRTHPRLDVMLSSRSPHPIDTIGCTVCHEGRGQSVDFTRAAHTPRNETQKKEWEKKYGWHSMHHVIEKMIPLQYTEGKCRTCHKQTETVPRAEKLNASNLLIRSAGCYGCHKIEGWDHIRKPGPSLKRIKGKVTRDWFVKWVREPKSFNDHSRMPSVFNQSNIETEEFKAYQEAEIQAVTDFLLSQSEDYTPPLKARAGNAANGKEIFGSVGCLACHGMDDFGRKRYNVAPDLTTIGSKVSPDWLASWLKNPRHYWSETVMPSLRLSDNEIADLTSYLMGKKNPEFEQAQAGTPDFEMQKKVLRLYYMRDPRLAPNTAAKVDAEIAALTPHQVSTKLGENTMNRYGCFSCHEVKGYEKTPSIAPELSEVGSKPLNKFDFGLLHINHANYTWMETKLNNPRIYDKGLVKEYLDLLKMPNFHLQEPEIKSLVTSLMGLTAQKVVPPAAKALNAREKKQEDGMRVMHQYNCQACHVVENLWQQVPDDAAEWEEHQKKKFDLEGKILTYYPEDETLGPPRISNEGEKVRTDWAHNFLKGPYPLRTQLKVRMPTFPFSTHEMNTLLTGWGNEGKVEFPFVPAQRVSMTPGDLQAAKVLFDRLQCLGCHGLEARPMVKAGEDAGSRGLAPSFYHTAGRLRRDWIVDWLKDPNKIAPGTRMPGFWQDGQSPAPDVLGGDSEKQIQVLADYLIYISQNNPMPKASE